LKTQLSSWITMQGGSAKSKALSVEASKALLAKRSTKQYSHGETNG